MAAETPPKNAPVVENPFNKGRVWHDSTAVVRWMGRDKENIRSPRIKFVQNFDEVDPPNPLAVTGLIILFSMLLMAIIVLVLAPPVYEDHYQMPKDYDDPVPPGAEGHPLEGPEFGVPTSITGSFGVLGFRYWWRFMSSSVPR